MKVPIYQVAKESLRLSDGGMIVLFDMLRAPDSVALEEVDGNVYRLSKGGEFIWQISVSQKTRPNLPFTNIFFDEEGALKAFRFNCVVYKIDINTGVAVPTDFWK